MLFWDGGGCEPLEKRRFEEWVQGDIRGNFFVLERRVPQVSFQDVYVPEIRRKFGISRVSWIQKEEDWKGKREELLSPFLFPEREGVFLEGLKEETVWRIAQEASQYDKAFFFFLAPPALKGAFWGKFPWIVVEESREAFLRFLEEEQARSGVFLEEEARETLFQLVLEHELQRGDIVDFLEKFRGERISKDTVEAFFVRNEKVLLFRFLDALGEKDTTSAIQYAYRLMDQQFPPPLLVAQIARRFRLLAQLHEVGGIQQDLWQRREINPFEARKIERMKKHFSPSDVPRVFAHLRTTDRLLKTQSIDLRLWFVLLVSGITQSERGAG